MNTAIALACPVGETTFSTADSPLTNRMQNPLSVGNDLSVGFIRGTSTLFGTQVLNIATLIQAPASESSTSILSTPALPTPNNQEAEVIVRQNMPFETGQFTNTEEVFDLIDRRKYSTALVLTSNRDVEEWGEGFPNSVLANATIDRLFEPAHTVVFKGKSYRLKGRITTRGVDSTLQNT